MRVIKSNSSKYINENNWTFGNFQWQRGYGAFSYSKSQVDKVVKYILNQKRHHEKESFQEEYVRIMDSLKIEFDRRYLFKSD